MALPFFATDDTCVNWEQRCCDRLGWQRTSWVFACTNNYLVQLGHYFWVKLGGPMFLFWSNSKSPYQCIIGKQWKPLWRRVKNIIMKLTDEHFCLVRIEHTPGCVFCCWVDLLERACWGVMKRKKNVGLVYTTLSCTLVVRLSWDLHEGWKCDDP